MGSWREGRAERVGSPWEGAKHISRNRDGAGDKGGGMGEGLPGGLGGRLGSPAQWKEEEGQSPDGVVCWI